MKFEMTSRQRYFRTTAKNQSNRLNIKIKGICYKRNGRNRQRKTLTSNERMGQRAITKFCAKAEMTPIDT